MLYDLYFYDAPTDKQYRLSEDEAKSLNSTMVVGYHFRIANLVMPSSQRFQHGDPLLYKGKYAGFFRDGDERTMRIVNLSDTVMIVSREDYTKAEAFPDRIIDAAGNYLGLDIGDFQIQGWNGRLNRRTSDVVVPYNLIGTEVFSAGGQRCSAITEQAHNTVHLWGGETVALEKCQFTAEGGKLTGIQLT